jgi:hypothetical protein
VTAGGEDHDASSAKACRKSQIVPHRIGDHRAVFDGVKSCGGALEPGDSRDFPRDDEPRKQLERIGHGEEDSSGGGDFREAVLRGDTEKLERRGRAEVGAEECGMPHHGEVFLSRAAEQGRDALGVVVVAVGENDRVELAGSMPRRSMLKASASGCCPTSRRQRKRVPWRVASTYRESPCCPSRGLS